MSTETVNEKKKRTKGEHAAELVSNCGPAELDKFAEKVASTSTWQAKHLAAALFARASLEAGPMKA